MSKSKGDDVLRVHPRTVACNAASGELGVLLMEWEKKHKLTAAEYLSILTAEMQSRLRSCVSGEREKS